MNALLVSADPQVRELMALAARRAGRRSRGEEPLGLLEAADGVQGMKLAWRHLPEVVVADEITSRAGAFALARDLKGSVPPFPGHVVILLDRREDQWLAEWSGADAWLVKPVNPFELADTIAALDAGSNKEAV